MSCRAARSIMKLHRPASRSLRVAPFARLLSVPASTLLERTLQSPSAFGVWHEGPPLHPGPYNSDTIMHGMNVRTVSNALTPAAVLSDHGIPHTVFMLQALAYGYGWPWDWLMSPYELHVLVPDDKIDSATHAITAAMPYATTSEPLPEWIAHPHSELQRLRLQRDFSPYSFCRSVALRATTATEPRHRRTYPENVFIHPQSSFHFDVSGSTSTIALGPRTGISASVASVRFPTLIALVNSVVASTLDPPCSRFNLLLQTHLRHMLYAVITLILRIDEVALPVYGTDGRLLPEFELILDGLHLENGPYFMYMLETVQASAVGGLVRISFGRSLYVKGVDRSNSESE
ncbi:hypothetical protein PENSPDRAFT_163538 [Peniophora sp. CONT]|nr:hypothetical protein PENSPDRAFT_163538 [Peniophora sp. CONT]